ncbi:transcriptional regulator, GntR family [Desulfonispora thiosulfatigenes DSM 11270]|uniref:Transcriptional regulator, GntR family n=1 Tax=Desulfonispora thiosulfatigenes DSM 11270 TaxID=656914 RepID=A0A1W1VHK3_DESTI|nr:GntR family transcriptional regulator [Desulfonispora thiosulfatigenes]SMB92434.1 transcriptional regulator, GntR family [Desulfonispora thiosulfatigenes DSM 11270]
MNLDFNDHMPLHIQLRELIRGEIIKGTYKDSKIPSERELMEEFKVSRTTVREAISGLVHEGVLQKKHGKGTFITFKPIEQWLGSLHSYTELIEGLKMNPGSKLLYKNKVKRPEYIQSILNTNEFYVIERLRYADNEPIAIERHYYPLEIGLKLAEFDLEKETIFELLESSLGIILAEADQSISSELPTKKDANHLEIAQNMSVLVTERMTYDPDGKIIEYYKAIYRSDKYVFRINLKRGNGAK